MEFCMSLSTKAMLQNLKKDESKNILTSPISLSVSLNMVASKAKGRTLEQLLGALGSESVEELNLASSKMLALFESKHKGDGPIMSIANGVWVDRKNPMKPSYKKIMDEVFEANAQTVDFERKRNKVVKEINSWAEKVTEGLVRNMLTRDDVSRDTSLFLGNALYFKGNWERNAFTKSKTSDEFFYLDNGKAIKVPFMKSEYDYHYYGSFDDFQLLKLPFKCGEGTLCEEKRFSMFVFLPLERNDLENLIQKLHDDPLLYRHCDDLKMNQLSKLWLPKFKFMYKFEPSDIIKEMGIDLCSMPLNDITETVVCVSKIIQQSCVEVNEKGTEAAAVTCKGVGQIAARRTPRGSKPPPSFEADHPFVFMIREDVSGTVFFTGAVFNPRKDGEKDEKQHVFKKTRTV